jgi:hypothetical protein
MQVVSYPFSHCKAWEIAHQVEGGFSLSKIAHSDGHGVNYRKLREASTTTLFLPPS